MKRLLHALILDDSDDDAVLLARALREQGYDVVWKRAFSDATMRAALDEARWDVVISDYAMPGFSIEKAFGVLEERNLDLPFILVSGSVGEEIAAGAMKAGAHDFFLKDRLARLGSAIDRELRDAEVRRERRAALVKLELSERELRRAVQVRDEFLAIASHELRTPLTPLVLQLQASLRLARDARASAAPEWAAEVSSRLENSIRYAERMTLLVLNLLDVTRITSGHLDLARQPIELRAFVTGVAGRLHDTMRRAEIRVAPGLPVEGSWDPTMIESVVLNLLSNAIKYGRDRPIDVSVERAGDVARLVVADQGIGIPDGDRQRIFERFERAVPAEHYGGFGLGLWVVAQIVRRHGGSVAVTTTKDVGSTFTVELPLAPPDAPDAAEA